MPTDETGVRVGPLSPYRVLDLTDEKGSVCGKMFADMGADVIKVEPPTGCTTRRIPPFLDGKPGIERSLYFLTYGAGKRSLTLDLHQADGRRLLTRLAETADFLVESYPTGALDSLGLAYDVLSTLNQRLIYVSIRPFGELGPGAHWKAADIVTWAAGGMMYLTGQPGRPPLQISFPQAGLHAGAEAAAASMLAHTEREQSGVGQRIVIDMQACVTWTTMSESPFPLLHGASIHRSGPMSGKGVIARTTVHRCADGYVTFILAGSTYARTSTELVRWMDERGVAPAWLKDVDFADWTSERFMTSTDPQFLELVAACEMAVDEFLMGVTRQEVYGFALERKLMIAPVSTVEDVSRDEQLADRQYFQRVYHPSLERELTLVGPFAKLTKTPIPPPLPAPTLGQHTEEILRGELALGREELEYLFAHAAV